LRAWLRNPRLILRPRDRSWRHQRLDRHHRVQIDVPQAMDMDFIGQDG
jgi:hypothetical protein